MASESSGDLNVSRETFDTLHVLEAEVRRWNPAVNLVSRNSLDQLWERHIVDSAQIFNFCPPDAKRWLDLGSGGGFPGLVVAILALEQRPDLQVTLVESDQRKAAFLRQTSQKLGLSVSVLAERIESIPPQGADVISARALAPLGELLGLSAPHINANGMAIFLKGARHLEEVAEARRVWSFSLDSHTSALHPDAALLIIRKFHRA